MVGGNEKPSANLIAVMNLERLENPIPVSSFVELSDNKPLKPRTTSGGWSYVMQLPGWVGTLTETAVEDDLNRTLGEEVSESLSDSSESRAQRLLSAPKYPTPIQILSRGFRRNSDVIAEVLLRADGHREKCGKQAPFTRAKDGTPYLEVHHKVMLSHGGADTVENAVATCPNCHRELHFGI